MSYLTFEQELLRTGYATAEQIRRARQLHQHNPTQDFLAVLAAVCDAPLPAQLHEQFQQCREFRDRYFQGENSINLQETSYDYREMLTLVERVLPFDVCRFCEAIPLYLQPTEPPSLCVGMPDPNHLLHLDRINQVLKQQQLVAAPVQITDADFKVGMNMAFNHLWPRQNPPNQQKPAIEFYVSTDVKTDGPFPGNHSLLSFASAVYLSDKTLVSTFTANLETLPGATADPEALTWWQTQPQAWDAARTNLQPPAQAMQGYLAWLKSFPGKVLFVSSPAARNFMFIHWYLHQFTGENPFGQDAIDIQTYAMAAMKQKYQESALPDLLRQIKAQGQTVWSQRYRRLAVPDIPVEWSDTQPRSHIALEDAIAQGALFCDLIDYNRHDQDLEQELDLEIDLEILSVLG